MRFSGSARRQKFAFCFSNAACGRSIGGERLGRFGFICVPSASRGHADERAFHLLLNALNGPAADATLAGNSQDAFAPCLPSRAERPPSGPEWLHEIKHDGFRIMARRDHSGVRLYTRNGYDFAGRFPQIVEAVSKLKVRSCFIDGEAIVLDERGLSAFDLLRSWRHDYAAVLCAFDLIEIDGKDLRRAPIEERKHMLADLVGRQRDGIVLDVHYDCEGATVFKHACALGCEGIVSKRSGSPYRCGRGEHWLKVKNPAAPAVKREAEEDWGNKRWSHARR
jgi:bifunctional non-homologous end joining protein LigD